MKDMKQKMGVVVLAAAGLLISSNSLLAHHSEAMLDKDHLVTIKGAVTEHEFINPHQIIRLKVTDADGRVRAWVVQGDPPGEERSTAGWTKDTLKAGDEITMTIYACKDGRQCGSWIRIVKSDGTELPLPAFKKKFLGEFLQNHGKELSKEEYEIYKKIHRRSGYDNS